MIIFARIYNIRYMALAVFSFLELSIPDILDILLLGLIIFFLFRWIRGSSAMSIFVAIVSLYVIRVIVSAFNMRLMTAIMDMVLDVGVLALIVIFQPEMRKALENLGRKNILVNLFNFDFNKVENGKFSDKTITELVKACYEMGKVKTGALIVVEDEIVLTEYERTGIAVDGILTSQLLINIFEKNTPLHDGAVIVRGDRVVSATCYLPLTDSLSLSKDLGTRHRAAVGISEVSDSLTIVVSEETGKVSIALDGELYRNVDAEFLKNKLAYIQKREQDTSKVKSWRRRLKDVTKIRKESNE